MSEGQKIPTREQVENFLNVMDKSAAKEGAVRKVQTIGTEDDGTPIQIVTWGKP